MNRRRLLIVPQTSTVKITEDWHIVKDGDTAAKELQLRHYSCHDYKDKREPKLFVGPGEKLVLLTTEADALFAWRYFEDDWLKGKGLFCAIYRNESGLKGTVLLKQALRVAECRWPGEPQFTYVDPKKIKSTNPGCVFKLCGFKKIGETSKGLHVLRREVC